MEENLRTYSSKLTLYKYGYRSRLFKIEEELFQKLAHNESLRVLDLGVGTGRTSHYFQRFRHYVGLDYSERMVEWCRRRFRDLSGERFIVGDARAIPLEAERFDVVIFSFNGIDYISAEDRARVLAEVHRVLAEDGKFFFSTHSIRSLGATQTTRKSIARTISDTWRSFLMRSLNPGVDLEATSRQDRAIVRDMPTLRTHYISLREQRDELVRAGFSIPHVLDEDGLELSLGGWEREPRGKWFYVIAEKARL